MGNQMAKQMNTNDAINCPNCNAVVPSSAKFCTECGAKMKPVCKNCNKELPAGTKFCPECGTKL